MKGYTKKNKKQQKGKKQKNTTFKKGGEKSIKEIIEEKLKKDNYKLIQQLIDNPDSKYAILIDFCKDNNLVVNTNAFLSDSFLPPDEGYKIYNDNLTIPENFEKGKLLEIVIFANKDGIQYNTVVKPNKFQSQNCKPDKLPVIYRVPEITTPDIKASRAEISSVTDEQLGEEVEDEIFRDSIPYDEDLTSQDNFLEQASINVNDLQEADLEDVTNMEPTSMRAPTNEINELKEQIKKEDLKGISEKPNLNNFKDDLALLKKKRVQGNSLRSREEGENNVSGKKIDFKELARERKEEKDSARKQQEEIDKKAHDARLLAEKEAEEMMFEEVSEDKAEKEEAEENLFKKYVTEIEIISNILRSMMKDFNSNNKKHRDDYTSELSQLKTKYEAFIDIFEKDKTINIPEKTKIINVLTNSHRRLQALRKYDTTGFKLKFESNFMDKVKDNLSIMNTLNTYFNTLDESLMKNFGNKPNVSYDYTKLVDGGKKTRKSRRKVKQRKTKKRI